MVIIRTMRWIRRRFALGGRVLLGLLLVAVGHEAARADSLSIPAADASIKTAGGRMPLPEGPPGSWNLWTNGELGDYVRFPSEGTCRIVVRASGRPAKMTLIVGEKPPGEGPSECTVALP